MGEEYGVNCQSGRTNSSQTRLHDGHKKLPPTVSVTVKNSMLCFAPTTNKIERFVSPLALIKPHKKDWRDCVNFKPMLKTPLHPTWWQMCPIWQGRPFALHSWRCFPLWCTALLPFVKRSLAFSLPTKSCLVQRQLVTPQRWRQPSSFVRGNSIFTTTVCSIFRAGQSPAFLSSMRRCGLWHDNGQQSLQNNSCSIGFKRTQVQAEHQQHSYTAKM